MDHVSDMIVTEDGYLASDLKLRRLLEERVCTAVALRILRTMFGGERVLDDDDEESTH